MKRNKDKVKYKGTKIAIFFSLLQRGRRFLTYYLTFILHFYTVLNPGVSALNLWERTG